MSAGDEAKETDPVCDKTVEAAKPDGGDVTKDAVKESKSPERAQKDEKGESAATDEFGLPIRNSAARRYQYDAEGEVVENPADKDGIEVDSDTANGVIGVSRTEASNKSNEANGVSETNGTSSHDADVGHEPVSATTTTAQTGQRNGQAIQESAQEDDPSSPNTHKHRTQSSVGGASVPSEWSHQQLAPQTSRDDEDDDDNKADDWQEMPAFATHRMYDDWGKVVAKEYGEVANEDFAYGNLGGAGKGYTRVQDDDAQSATSMDDDTAYLFKNQYAANTLQDEDEEGRDIVSQMQATKELLTEGQRIAYVGVVRLSIGKILSDLDGLEKTKGARKQLDFAVEATKMWGQKMMFRLYKHMDIDQQEQIMVEQLNEHGVLPGDLTPALMQNARVRNPNKKENGVSDRSSISSPVPPGTPARSTDKLEAPGTPRTPTTPPPPAYEEHTADDLQFEDASHLDTSKEIDLDLRWTVLCDLFLLLIADSNYDARSRTLLELVGAALSVDWQEVGRFEKRVTDALEMQQQADKEDWNEDEHLVSRAKSARKKRLMVMGLCTVGGGLVIGLSAGLLAPVIGAGLAAGFTTIGVAGTSTFLGGTGAAALIGTTGTLTGTFIGIRASDRRTGAVKTFEYRPLFNNKRANLIVTVSGWMTGNVDDVRLPFSTVNPIMGDIYSVNWEPDMLRSTGQTISILATEALTQTVQQVLGSTILTALMAGLTLPLILAKLSYLIDNPWNVSLARADATGLILADSLIDRNLGVRPITLVGFSLGSRVIFSCLKELARRGAYGLVQDVYVFGTPVVAKKDDYLRAKTAVSGRFVNGYATNDWILGYLFRATSGGIMRVSGLAAVDVPGIENKNVTELVPGHMAYRGKMPKLLKEVGWQVDSEEFSEIEDPDPENHEKRQRELIDEIEAARRDLEAKEEADKAAANADDKKKKKPFMSLFTRKTAPKKKAWEMYDDRSQKQKVLEGDEGEAEKVVKDQSASNVMFDVEAIRQEALKLAVQGGDVEEIKRHMSFREVQGTMPPLKISSPTATTPKSGHNSPHGGNSAARPFSNGHGRDRPSYERNAWSYDDNKPQRSTEMSDEKISLSFEPTPAPPYTPDRASNASASLGLGSPAGVRPPLRTATTTPSPTAGTMNGGREKDLSRPWATQEEDEVKMTFE